MIKDLKLGFKYLYLFFKLSITQAFCKHEWEFHSNEYGDPIWEGGFHRSNWFCKKCGRWEGREYLVNKNDLENIKNN